MYTLSTSIQIVRITDKYKFLVAFKVLTKLKRDGIVILYMLIIMHYNMYIQCTSDTLYALLETVII